VTILRGYSGHQLAIQRESQLAGEKPKASASWQRNSYASKAATKEKLASY